MRDIAIVSRNSELSSLIALEAELCGASSRILSRIPADGSGYKMIFIDTDTVEIQEVIEGTSVFLISVALDSIPSSSRYGAVLRYPLLLTELRRVILGAGIRGEAADREKMHTSVIYADKERREIELEGRKAVLSENEFAVLSALCLASGKAVSRAELDELLGVSEGNMSDVYICRLRKKLEELSSQKVIYTVRGIGYSTEFSLEWL